MLRNKRQESERPRGATLYIWRAIWQSVADGKVARDGNSPTLREISDEIGLSTTAVKFHVDRMARAGLLEAPGRKSHGIRLKGGRYQPPKNPLAAGRN